MKRGDDGFTLIDMAVTIAIAAIIAAGAGMGVVQIIEGSQRNNDHATVVRQAQNLGSWFSRDALMAQSINASDDTGTADIEFITIYWRDWENGDAYDIRYLWLDYAGSLKKINRKQVVTDKDGLEIRNTTTLVAHSIYSANLSQQSNTWRLIVETHSGQQSLTREYRIAQRLE